MSIMDLLDDLVFGPMNLINRTEGIIKRLFYRDIGYQFAIPRIDKGGAYSFSDVQILLRRYGIDSFGGTHDAQCIYFWVKQRQAVWAEYLLLHAGIELRGPRADPHNAQYVATHPPGWMPKPWSEQRGATLKRDPPDDTTEASSFWHKLDSMIDDLLKWD